MSDTRPDSPAADCRPSTVARFAWTVFRAGWRPALGWALTPSILYGFIVGPLIRRPADVAELVAMLLAAAGLVAARTVEKTRGVA